MLHPTALRACSTHTFSQQSATFYTYVNVQTNTHVVLSGFVQTLDELT